MTQDPATLQLTDAGRAYMRRLRAVLVPVRVLGTALIITLPVGLRNAWDHPVVRVFLVALGVMVVLERVGITEDPSARSRDRASKMALVVTSFAAMALGVWEAMAATPLGPVTAAVEVRAAGLAVWALGLGVRQWAIWTLGRFFTDRVRIFDDHALITHGPYRLVRHPSYAGLALVFLGAPLSLGSALAVLLSVVAGGAAVWFRVRVEEAELRQHFGATYDAYAATTPALLPWPRPRPT